MAGLLHLAPGVVFAGDFKVVRPLDEGGMGAVYVVEQSSTGKQRALKVMHAELASDETMRGRFVNEAKVGSRIESDHIVEVVSAGIDAATGAPYLVMELLSGETLAHRVERKGPLSSDEGQVVVSQLCHALAAAHDVGIVHRDLKPENVFLAVARREGVPFTVKVLDFGIAKLIADASSRSTGAIGSPLWMAPEQASTDQLILPATDVWALGLLVFWMLTGREYWRSAHAADPNPMALLLEAATAPIEAASERAKYLRCSLPLPAGFDEWFAKCLERDVNLRYKDAREARSGLERLLRVTGGAVTEVGRSASLTDVPDLDLPAPPAKSQAAAPKVSEPKSAAASGSANVAGKVAAVPPATPSQAPASRPMQPRRIAVSPLPQPRTTSPRVRRIEPEAPPAKSFPWWKVVVGVVVVVGGLAVAQHYFWTGTVAPASSASALAPPPPAAAHCPADMALVAGGTLQGNRPSMQVDSFCVDFTEVTVASYAACAKDKACTSAHPTAKWSAGATPASIAAVACNQARADRGDHPANCVDWEQARAFCVSRGKRLPSDAEWEWVAGGGAKRSKYPWGDDVPYLQLCWSDATKQTGTCPVAKHGAGDSPLGVHDLEGNVREWTSTSFSKERLVCGMDWTDKRDTSRSTLGACSRVNLDDRSPFVGFRCVASPT